MITVSLITDMLSIVEPQIQEHLEAAKDSDLGEIVRVPICTTNDGLEQECLFLHCRIWPILLLVNLIGKVCDVCRELYK